MGGAAGRHRARQRTEAPSPVPAHLVPASGRCPFLSPPPSITQKGNLPPRSGHASHPTQVVEARSTARLGSGKKPGTENEAGLVLIFLARFPRGLRCRHPRRCRLNSPLRHRASLLPARGSRQPRFHVGARRFGWEGVGDRGLRCQRPPPLEVGRERVHVCCLLFVCTCLAICPSLALLPPGGYEFWGAEGSSCMLDATLRVRGCRGRVGDDGWVVGQKTLPSPKREKRFKNAAIKKKVEHYPLSR